MPPVCVDGLVLFEELDSHCQLEYFAEAMASGESQNEGDRTAMQTDEEEDVKPKIHRDEDGNSQRDEDEERTEPASSPEPFNREKPPAQEQAPQSAAAGQINYDALSPEELFARVDQGQLGRLQLLKRYHADARAFIRLLEDGFKEKDEDTPGAIFKVIELLYSKAKSEVLEAVDFLTIASQYRLEASDVSVIIPCRVRRRRTDESSTGGHQSYAAPHLVEGYEHH